MRKLNITGQDSKVVMVTKKIWDMIVLNFLTAICCIPVITAGASLTAMYAVLLRMRRNEESYVTRDFFRDLKSNFKKSTLLWVVKLAFLIPMIFEVVASRYAPGTLPTMVVRAALIAGFLALMLLSFTLPLQSHFENSLAGTLTNSVKLGISKFPRAFVMTFIWILPLEILLHVLALYPLVLLLGFTFPGYICVRMYEPVFSILEPEEDKE